jgi:hypothetical protein
MRLFLVIIGLLAVATPHAQETNLFRIGPLSLMFPATWQFDGSKRPIEGRGPNGGHAIVSYRGLEPDAPEYVREKHVALVRGFAETEMPRLATKNGTVVKPVTEVPLDSRRFMFTAASQSSRLFREYYFVQYLLGSPTAMAYFTFEGYGSAIEASQRLDTIMATQRWGD